MLSLPPLDFEHVERVEFGEEVLKTLEDLVHNQVLEGLFWRHV